MGGGSGGGGVKVRSYQIAQEISVNGGECRGKRKDENKENLSFCIVYLDWGLD